MRHSIHIDGFSHGSNPVPAGCVIGDLLMTGAVFGTDPATGRVAQALDDQLRLMFDHAGRILQAAGGGFEDVIKMTFHARPEVERERINHHWVAAFPDPASRPARHVIVSDRLPAGMQVQCDLIARLRPQGASR